MIKGSNRLIFRFAVLLCSFSLLMLILFGITNYFIQTISYKSSCQKKIMEVGDYLVEQIGLQPEEFAFYQNYYMEHFNEVDIPYSFTECSTAKAQFESLLAREIENGMYPDGWSLEYLSEEAKKAWFIYYHEYWTLAFENARKAFDIPYTYYLVIKEDVYHVVYMIDGERSIRQTGGKSYLFLGDEYYNSPQDYSIEWNTWFTGKKQSKCQILNNNWGHTYAYYTPLIIDNVKMGLVGTEFMFTTLNNGIASNLAAQLTTFAIIFFIGMIVVLYVVNKKYISKLEKLEAHVRKYSLTKNYKIAEKIEAEISGENEISILAKRISEMILEIENYMRNLFSNKGDFDFSSLRDNDFMNRDALTGIRAGISFENELLDLEKERKNGFSKFGFAFIDLNDLGKLNANYGLENGNAAIKKLCSIVCSVFEHSPVYRVGGDDFVAILKNEDYDKADELPELFNEKLIQIDEAIEPWEDISASIGIALYKSESDVNVEAVLNRSELNMKNNKKAMKARFKL